MWPALLLSYNYIILKFISSQKMLPRSLAVEKLFQNSRESKSNIELRYSKVIFVCWQWDIVFITRIFGNGYEVNFHHRPNDEEIELLLGLFSALSRTIGVKTNYFFHSEWQSVIAISCFYSHYCNRVVTFNSLNIYLLYR